MRFKATHNWWRNWLFLWRVFLIPNSIWIYWIPTSHGTWIWTQHTSKKRHWLLMAGFLHSSLNISCCISTSHVIWISKQHASDEGGELWWWVYRMHHSIWIDVSWHHIECEYKKQHKIDGGNRFWRRICLINYLIWTVVFRYHILCEFQSSTQLMKVVNCDGGFNIPFDIWPASNIQHKVVYCDNTFNANFNATHRWWMQWILKVCLPHSSFNTSCCILTSNHVTNSTSYSHGHYHRAMCDNMKYQ